MPAQRNRTICDFHIIANYSLKRLVKPSAFPLSVGVTITGIQFCTDLGLSPDFEGRKLQAVSWDRTKIAEGL